MPLPELNATHWPPGSSEMARRMRSHPWHRSALGPVTRWAPYLRTATELMIGSPLPTLILSGVDGVAFYNDAFIPLLGSMHPSLLGSAMSTAPAATAGRFHALLIAVEAGETAITEDDWLIPPEEWPHAAHSNLACSPLRNSKGKLVGLWAQMLTPMLAAAPPDSSVSTMPLQSSLAAVGVAAWVWNPAAGTLHLTQGAAELLGLPPERARTFESAHFDFVHPLDRHARSVALDELLTSTRSYRSEFRIVRPRDQRIVWLEERAHTVRDPVSGRTLTSAVLWEMHDRNRATGEEEQTERSRTRYAAALDIDTVGIAFFRPDGVITEANDTYCGMHGITRLAVSEGRARWGDGTAQEWLTLLRRCMYEYQVNGRVLPHERECVRADGERWWGLFSARQLSATEGVEYVIDISTRMLAERNLKDSERRMRTLMEGVPQIVWRSRESGLWTWASPQWTELTGQPQVQSCGVGWLDMVHPDDRAEAHTIWHSAAWQQTFEANYRLWHIGENRYRTFKTRATPVRDEAGHIIEWLGTSTDIEDLQQLHGRLRVLVAELQHRTRNLLALVRSIAGQTLGRASAHERQLYTSFSDRLAALSRVQSLVTRSEEESVDLESLLRAELSALRTNEHAAVELRGPKVALPPTHAQMLALVTHELATNAAKYGALATPGARLSVAWETEQHDGEGETLHLKWRESGVPLSADAGRRKGFGRELIEEALVFSLDAQTELRFEADGVACSVALPLTIKRSAVLA